MNDPCKTCDLYPHACSSICENKQAYLNEIDEHTPIVRAPRKKCYEINKNGIRRVIYR